MVGSTVGLHGVGISKIEVSEAACPQMMDHSVGGHVMVRSQDRPLTSSLSHSPPAVHFGRLHRPRCSRHAFLYQHAQGCRLVMDKLITPLPVQLPGTYYVEAAIEAGGGVPCVLTNIEFTNRCLVPLTGGLLGTHT